MHRHGDVVDQCDLARRIQCVRVEGIVDEVQRIGRAPPSRAEPVKAQPAGDDHSHPSGSAMLAMSARASRVNASCTTSPMPRTWCGQVVPSLFSSCLWAGQGRPAMMLATPRE
jgi:hypothetical protein